MLLVSLSSVVSFSAGLRFGRLLTVRLAASHPQLPSASVPLVRAPVVSIRHQLLDHLPQHFFAGGPSPSCTTAFAWHIKVHLLSLKGATTSAIALATDLPILRLQQTLFSKVPRS